MHVHDAPGVALERAHRVAAGKSEVPRVEQQAHRGRRIHHAVHLVLAFDHRAHVMVIGELEALLFQMAGHCIEPFAERLPFLFGQPWPARQRHQAIAVHAARHLGEHHDLAVEFPQEIGV
jgi:hypothetical protein